jgi:hypothetical protein
MFQVKYVEKTKAHALCSITFFENRAVYETMWKKYYRIGQATDDNTIRRMHIACSITVATNTHLEYITLIDFPQQQWLQQLA